MNSNTVFSVVDLETTGNSTHEDNRIIQFSCALVQNNKIIRVYSTNVNAEIDIPARITNLTGIDNAQIKNAPTFTALADKIYKLLSGTVFVAHNVNFDFPFLNHELKRVGHSELNIKALDTVTLSQILLPMVPSFRLRDLTTYFGIKHEHPHDASSDAIATAHLFLVLVKRLRSLPTPTLKSILGLQLKLPLSTGQLIQAIYQNEKVHAESKMPANLMVKHGLVIRKFTRRHKAVNHHEYTFPFNNDQKLVEFDNQIKFIPGQVQLMNAIYDNYAHRPIDNLLVATNKGIGKKFGYGLPLAYLSHNHHQKVIVSVSNRDNGIDFINKTIPVIRQLAPFSINYSILKSANNYIDLNRFFVSLSTMDQSMQFQFIKARILVWLTMTTTGDLGELNLNPQLPYFNEINHRGIKSVRPSQPFYQFDFLRRARNSNKYSNLLITTHDYLLRHAKQISQQNQKPLLVIDNALDLNSQVIRSNRITIELNHINVLIRKLQSTIRNTHSLNLINIIGNQKEFKKSLRRLSQDLQTITDTLTPIQKRLSNRFLSRHALREVNNHLVGNVDSGQLRDEYNFVKKKIASIKKNWKACFENANRIINGPAKGYPLKQQYVLDHFQSLVLAITREIQAYHDFLHLLNQHADQVFISIYANQVHDFNNAFVTEELLNPEFNLYEQLFKFYPPVLLVDNLNVDHRLQDFTFKKLGLNEVDKRLVQIDHFNVDRPITVIKDAPSLNTKYNANTIDYYVQMIINAIKNSDNQSYFIFNSKSLLRQVFFALTEQHFDERYNVMAEGISGNQSKLIKNILNDGSLSVLGTLETLKANKLIIKQFKTVMIVDLPILLPDSTRNRFILKQAAKSYSDVQHNFVIPNAVLKLNQELALTNSDQFVAILDSRLIHTDIGENILNRIKNYFKISMVNPEKLSFAQVNFFKNFVKK